MRSMRFGIFSGWRIAIDCVAVAIAPGLPR